MNKQKRDILTKELRDKSDMIRFVRGPECKIYPDLSEKLPGRGMWVLANKESLQEVIDGRMFNKACHNDCKPDASIVEDVSNLLKARVLNLLSLSKKSGDLTLGFDKVLDCAKSGNMGVFIIASDSGEDGKSKISHKLLDTTTIIDKFTGVELQHALGQDTVVVYAGVKNSKMAKKISETYKKLIAF